jgi:hypothetical protein
MTEQTKSDLIRAYIKANGPVTGRQIAEALGLGFGQAWGWCNPMVRRGILLCDESGRYSHGRDARPNHGRRVDPAIRQERERLRLQNRAKLRKEARAAEGRVVRARRTREIDAQQRRSERAQAAQAMRNRELGLRTVVPAPARLESVDEWMARTGNRPEVLRIGEVSPASQFQRIQVAA